MHEAVQPTGKDLNGNSDLLGDSTKFVPPAVANGHVYMATFSNGLVAYGLLNHGAARPAAEGSCQRQTRCHSAVCGRAGCRHFPRKPCANALTTYWRVRHLQLRCLTRCLEISMLSRYLAIITAFAGILSISTEARAVSTDDCLKGGKCAYVDTKGHVTCGKCPGQAHVLNVPEGTTSVCNDATFETRKERRGACTGHAGVAVFLAPDAKSGASTTQVKP